MKKQLAIVGMGVSGLAVLLALSQLEDNILDKIDIFCFDNPEHFGKGIPFQRDDASAWINSPINDISYDYRHMDDFQRWMQQKGFDRTQDYVPRSLYGLYMTEKTKQLVDKLQATVCLQKVESVTYVPSARKWLVQTKNQALPTLFDELHLCCGQLPVLDPYQLEGRPHYISDPYPLDHLQAKIGKGKEIAVIGTGLAAVDGLKWLLTNSQADLLVFSRSNYFPTVRILQEKTIDWQFLTQKNRDKLLKESNFSFHSLEKLFLSELQAQGFQDWEATCHQFLAKEIKGLRLSLQFPAKLFVLQQLASKLVDWLTDLWPMMTLSDRQSYKESYEKAIINLRNPMPEASARLLMAAEKEGRLRVLEKVQAIKARDKGFELRQDGGFSFIVDTVVNASGYHLTEVNLHQATPLIQDVINQRICQIDPEGGLTVLSQTGQVLSPRYGLLTNLYAHGALVNGVIYQNNSTIKIQQMAERAFGKEKLE